MPITIDKFYHQTKCSTEQFVSNIWSYEDFCQHDIHILKSTTGTGKTTAVATHMVQYMKEHPCVMFLTLTARQTLSSQHKKSFKSINPSKLSRHTTA